jgi:hypothetical protein
MKKTLTIIFICCFYLSIAQNFYEIKWQGTDGIKYIALVEFFEKENINVRVNYTTSIIIIVMGLSSLCLMDKMQK